MPKRNKWALEDIQSFRGQELEEDDEGAEVEPIEQVQPPAPPRPPPVGPVVKEPAPAQVKPTPGAGPEELYHTLEEWEDLLRTTGIQPETPEQFAARQPAVPSAPQIPSFAPAAADETIQTAANQKAILDTLLKVFPDDDFVSLENIINFANETPDTFADELRKLGRSPDSERLLKAVSPNTSPDKFWQPVDTGWGSYQYWLDVFRPQGFGPDVTPEARARAMKRGELDAKAMSTLIAGVGDVISSAGSAARWLGFDGVAETLSGTGQALQRKAPAPMPGEFEFADMLDPEFYATKVVRTVPFALSFLPLAVGGFVGGGAVATALGLGKIGSMIIGGIGGAALTRPLESAMEAGGSYEDAQARGKSEAEAKKEADEVFRKNMLMGGADAFEIAIALAPTPKWVPSSLVKRGLVRLARIGGKMVIVGLSEGGEEVYQDMVQRHARGEEWKLDAVSKEVFAIGAAMGVGMGIGGDVLSGIVEKAKTGMSGSLKAKFDASVTAAVEQGVSPEQADLQGLEAVSTTPEGQSAIQRAINSVKEALADQTGAIKIPDWIGKRAEVTLKNLPDAVEDATFKSLQERAVKFGFDIDAMQGIAPNEYWFTVTLNKNVKSLSDVAKPFMEAIDKTAFKDVFTSSGAISKQKAGQVFLPFQTLADVKRFVDTGDVSAIAKTVTAKGKPWTAEELAGAKETLAKQDEALKQLQPLRDEIAAKEAEIAKVREAGGYSPELQNELWNLQAQYNKERLGIGKPKLTDAEILEQAAGKFERDWGYKLNEQKKPWEMTYTEWESARHYNNYPQDWPTTTVTLKGGRQIVGHEAVMRKAIAEGKDIPLEVLENYPDLQAAKGAAPPVTKGAEAEWQKVIANADEYGGIKGVTEIIERSGLAREAKDNLLAQLRAGVIPPTGGAVRQGEVPIAPPTEAELYRLGAEKDIAERAALREGKAVTGKGKVEFNKPMAGSKGGRAIMRYKDVAPITDDAARGRILDAYNKVKNNVGYSDFNAIKKETGLDYETIFGVLKQEKIANPYGIDFTSDRVGNTVFFRLSKVPGKGAAPAAKEPWQMTYKEVIDATVAPRAGPSSAARIQVARLIRDYAERQGYKYGQPFDPEARIATVFTSSAHRESIQKALSEGKPVPLEVLKDYPDLVAKATAAPVEAPAPTPAVEGAAEAVVPEKAEAPVAEAPGKPPPTKPPAPPLEPTPAEPGDSAKWFADYLADPSREKGAELQKRMFRQERAKRFQALVPRTEELIASGLDVEQAFNQARQEALTGELPRVTTDFFDEMTARARNDLFAKVQETLKDEPTELTSTMQALTNALRGQEIPREVGIGTKAFPEGGSALKRLQRVFAPEQLAAIEKLGKAKKTLHEIAETVWREPADVGSALYPGALGLQGDLFETAYPSGGPRAIDWARRYIETSRSEYEARVKAAREKYEAELEGFYKRYEAELEAWQKIPIWERTQSQQFELAFEPTGEGMTALEWAKKNIAEAQERYQRELQEMERQYQAELEATYKRLEALPEFSDVGAKQMPMIPAAQRNMIVAALKEAGLTAIDIGNFLRANKASFDLSFWRQQAPLIMNNKRSFITANIEGWKAIWSQKAADASWERITRDPLYQYYVQRGYDFLRPLTLKPGTEQYRGVEEFGYPGGERPIPKFTEKIPHVKMSQRGFVTGANEHNWAIFKQFYASMLKVNEKVASGEIKMKPGEAFSINQEMGKFASMLQDFTGRAELGKVGTIAPALSSVMFAPRLALGRLLTPRHLISSSKYVRAEAWKNLASFVGVGAGTLLIGQAMGLWDVEDDPRSADFMNIRIGNTRIDVWGGYKQYVVLAARITATILGKTFIPGMKGGKASDTGQLYEVNPLDALGRFARGKAAPLAAILMEFMTGKTFINEDVDIKDPKQWIDHIAPFAAIDIYEAFMDDPMIGALSVGPAMLGAGVATYTGDWVENFRKLGLPKYTDNLSYGLTEPRYDTKDFWADTAPQFKGVDPKTLTKEKAYPDYIRSIAEAQVTLGMLDQMPNQSLASINTDPSKGPTFREFYKMWRDRQKLLGDEEALKKFDQDERTRNSQLGNMSQREYALLNEYHLLSKDKQKDFLKEHPELAVNPRTDWLKKHPKENAQLAIWGQAKVLSMEAYKETQRLLKSLDIPDSAIPEFTLPPEKSIETHFKYEDFVAEGKHQSWEAQLLLAKDKEYTEWRGLKGSDTPVAALELRVKNRANYDKEEELKGNAEGLKKFRADNPAFIDDSRRIEAIEKDGEQHQELWVKRGKAVDEFGGSSSEAKVFFLDNPEVHQWALTNKLVEDDGTKWNAPALRLNVKLRKQDAEYNALPTTGDARKQYMADNSAYRKDDRRREAYQSDFPDTEVENYVGYYELPVKGKRQERFLVENPAFARMMAERKGIKLPDPKTVPSVQYDDLYDQHKDKFEQYEMLIGDDRKAFLRRDAKFADVVNRREAYSLLLDKAKPEYIDAYVEHYKFPDAGMERELHFAENPDFEKALWTAKNPKADPALYKSSVEKHIESLRISVKYKDLDFQYTNATPARRQQLLSGNPEYARARYMRQGYDYKFPDDMVPKFADYSMIPEKGWAKERYRKANPKFDLFATKVLKWEPLDYDRVPSQGFENLYDQYQNTPPGNARKTLRWNNPDFDAEGEKLGYWTKLSREPGGLSASDKKLQEWWDDLSKMKLTPIRKR